MNLKEVLAKKLSSRQLSLMQRSFDIIGNIAVIEIPNELKKKEKIIAEALLRHRHIKTVLKKSGKVSGRLRTRKLKWIAGERTKETEHRESGCRFLLDAETCYFSPRLSNDRLEIAKQVKPREKVLVMFSGVGPYPIVLAKNSKAEEVYGIELNRTASKYALKNVALNKLTNVKLIQGDVKKVIPLLLKKTGKFDRIVMARPNLKDMFLEEAFMAARKGTVIHLHAFLDDEDIPNAALAAIENALTDFSKKKLERIHHYRLLRWQKAGDIGPRKHRIRVDFVVE